MSRAEEQKGKQSRAEEHKGCKKRTRLLHIVGGTATPLCCLMLVCGLHVVQKRVRVYMGYAAVAVVNGGADAAGSPEVCMQVLAAAAANCTATTGVRVAGLRPWTRVPAT
jgi:hypothetical protein